MGSLGTGGIGRVLWASSRWGMQRHSQGRHWRRQPWPDRGGRCGERGGLRSVPGPVPAGHGLLHHPPPRARLTPHGVPAAGRPRLAPWCRSTAQLAEAPRGSATFKIQDKGSRPSRSPEGACSGGTGEFRPCVGPARGGRQLTLTGEQSLPCRLPGAVPSIRRVSFQVSAAHTAHSAPARLQSTWPGRGRSALQTGLGPHQGLKRVSSLAAVTEKRTLVLEPTA